jgi:hypothetical protein
MDKSLYQSDEFKSMYKRVVNNIKIPVRKKTGKGYDYLDLNKYQATVSTITCLKNNLIPEENHLVLIGGNPYITWDGMKHILKINNVYWETAEEDYTYSNNGVTCKIKVNYLYPTPGVNAWDNYNEFISKWLEKGVPGDTIINSIMPSSWGVGFVENNNNSYMKVSVEGMAKKRAIMNAFSYSPIIDGTTDWNGSGDDITNDNDKNKIEIDESLVDITQYILINIFNKEKVDELDSKSKSKLKKWLENLAKINVDERSPIVEAQVSIIEKLQKNAEMQKPVMDLLKAKGFHNIYEVDHITHLDKVAELMDKLENKGEEEATF